MMPPPTASPPVALSIAGSDCSAGAGIQADLKVFSAFGVYGLTALTCAVSETARVVEDVIPLPPAFVVGQVRLLLDSFPVAAIKTGMLFSAPHIEAVLSALENWDGPLVVDPVMLASTGTPLIEPDAIDLYCTALLPRATLITPNLDEASVLLGGKPIARDNLAGAAVALQQKFGCAVLLKGGHLRDGTATDLLVTTGAAPLVFDAPYTPGFSTHGTGCAFSAAITAGLARGQSLADAVAGAKAFISAAIARSFIWQANGHAIDALNLSGLHAPALSTPPHGQSSE